MILLVYDFIFNNIICVPQGQGLNEKQFSGYILPVEILLLQGVSKKSRQFRNGSQPREAASSMKFFVNIDCLGTCDVE